MSLGHCAVSMVIKTEEENGTEKLTPAILPAIVLLLEQNMQRATRALPTHQQTNTAAATVLSCVDAIASSDRPIQKGLVYSELIHIDQVCGGH